jgi:tetratricopeptide (TPR) repeat protein
MRINVVHRLIIAFGVSALVAHVEPETVPQRLSEQAYAWGLLQGQLSARSGAEALAEVEAALEAQAYRKALALARRTLVRFPERGDVRFLIAQSYRALGEPEAAAEALAPLIGTRFERSARVALFEAWLAAGQPDRAMQALRVPADRGEPLYSAELETPLLIEASLALPRPPASAAHTAALAAPLPRESGFNPPLMPDPEPAAEPEPAPIVPAAGAEATPAEAAEAEVMALLETYWAGDYSTVTRVGPELVLRYPQNAELRLAVANSFAWTGQLDAAVETYRPLLETELRVEALLGIGNSYRWLGRPSKAAPLIEEAARARPNDADIQKAQRQLGRELRARTGAEAEYASDSTDAERTSAGLVRRFWTEDHASLIEAGMTSTVSRRGGLRTSWETLGLAMERPEAPLSPRLHAEYQQRGDGRLFGGVRLQLRRLPLSLGLEAFDWGLADPRAAQDGLHARHLELDARPALKAGKLWLSYDHYSISDGNRVQEGSLEFTPGWQPWGQSSLKWLVAFYGRKAEREDPRYWSPADGYYTFGPGIKADGGDERTQWYASARLGLPLTDSSSTSWNAAAGGRHWLSERVAAGTELFYTTSTRDDADYRGFTVGAHVEALW